MGKLFFALVIFLLVIGCSKDEPPKHDFEYRDDIPQKKEEKPIPETPKEVKAEEVIPSKGTVSFKSKSSSTLPVMDMTADLDISVSGEFSYEISKKNLLSGEGKGKTKIKISSDLGIADCFGEKEVSTTFKVNGIYDPKTNNILIFTNELKPKKASLTLDCPSDSGDLEYELELPIIFFINEGGEKDLIIQHKNGALVKKKVKHPLKDWDAEIEADWEFELKVLDTFDFDVDVDPVSVSVEQGGTVTPHITARLTRGKAKDVSLTVTKWQNINAHIADKIVTPTETTTLTIETTCDTPVDNYLFTVQGETSGTFKTSVDSVNVQVKENPSC